MVLAVRGDYKLAFTSGPDAVLLHEPADPLFAHAVAACNQFFPHLGPTVGAPAGGRRYPALRFAGLAGVKLIYAAANSGATTRLIFLRLGGLTSRP